MAGLGFLERLKALWREVSMLDRARRGPMLAGAFRDLQCDRCPQDVDELATPAIRVVACVEDRERISRDSHRSSHLLVVCAANPLMEEGSSGRVAEASAAAAKKLRSSSWSGLALPRLCVERNLASCKKLGFMATRKSRTLSLDGFDFSKADLLSGSPDDSSLANTKSLSKESAISKRSRGRSLERSFRFDSWRREEGCCILLDAPSKFLQLQALEEDRDADSSWFKSPASVPFKWEDAPGRPKPEPADHKPDLQLPPRLLARSCSISRSNPSTGFAQRRARSITHKQGMFLGADAKAPDPTSPTSILNAPDTSSASCSASYSESPGSEVDSGTIPRGRKTKSSFVRTIEKVFEGSWLRKKKKFRGSKEMDPWAPTLATYFQSVEAATAKKDEVVVSHSGPAVLVRSSSRREWRSAAPIGNSEVEESDFEDLEVASCSCSSPMVAPSPRLVRSASSTEHRSLTDQRRKTKRLAKSSNFFQTFMHKAVMSVRPRRRTPLELSRLSYRPVV